MPGSEQWNIRIAARCYIKGGRLQEGEKLFFVNGIQRKCLREWHGQTCKYVAVKYTFRKANENLDQRIIHLLMTEHCDSIIDCSYDGKAEWVKSDDLLNKEPLIAMMKGSENGGYLLSHKRSTIGVAELNDPVRNGKGWDLSTITT